MNKERIGLRTEASATIKLAIPIIIGELAQMALHIIDSAMVGSIDYHQLAAVALVINTINIPLVFGIGMTIAVSQMVSMANGRNDDGQVSHYLFNGFVLCSVMGIVISLALCFGTGILYHLGQDPEVVHHAVPFMKLMSLSMIPMLMFMTLKQFTDGLEYTKTAMVLSLISLPLNVFINWLLVYGNWGAPRLELVGAGWGTLITRTLMFFVLLIVVFRHKIFQPYISVRSSQWKIRRKTMGELLHIGTASSLQLGMEAGAFAVSGIIIGTLGAVAQAAHQIALSLAAFTFMVSMGLAQAGSIRVSNSFGRKDWGLINLIGKSTMITALIYGVLCAIIFASFRFLLPQLFNDNTEVIALAATLLLFAAVFQISDATQAISAGLLRGIKDVKTPTLLIAVAYWVIGIPVGWFFAFQLDLGASGMWLGLITGLTFAAGFLAFRFLKMVKKENRSLVQALD
ncbi:MATE family efflux transporter [Pseudobacter ginsenosidimutans]|jgi:MATE family multidrug resistance protein|uniref:Multidrug-efflux transporter n=1 Tax=Pseudobacter ginsenosidimutans TaxID=661488 RepID=A0A4Q7N2Z1_9BACT|nr:MATE family efflux transporter [Pseudobacter ginsenosidimutans]RZS75404.1 MATE family multidrug resistance protein [Pseudobacter ginsenosidimutans]